MNAELKYPYVHEHYFEPEFLAWTNMRARCRQPRWARWYGHVRVCAEWETSYDAFLAHVGRRPSPGHSLDRIDVTRGYEPGNVRWVTRYVQGRNTKNHCTNKTGVRGVSWCKSKGKWRAAIYVKNKQTHVGYFDTLEEAAVARKAAEDKLWGDER
jgi:hypothetical protein